MGLGFRAILAERGLEFRGLGGLGLRGFGASQGLKFIGLRFGI